MVRHVFKHKGQPIVNSYQDFNFKKIWGKVRELSRVVKKT